jgi:hypothetical protein
MSRVASGILRHVVVQRRCQPLLCGAKTREAVPSPTRSRAALETHSMSAPVEPTQRRAFHRDSCLRGDGDTGRWTAEICPPQHEWHGRCSGAFGARVSSYGACVKFIANSSREKSCTQFCSETHRDLGRMLPPSDRANLSGPFYVSAWSFPGVVSNYPNLAVGRDNGMLLWGKRARNRSCSACRCSTERAASQKSAARPCDRWREPTGSFPCLGTSQ